MSRKVTHAAVCIVLAIAVVSALALVPASVTAKPPLFEDFETDLSDWTVSNGSGSISIADNRHYTGNSSVLISDVDESQSTLYRENGISSPDNFSIAIFPTTEGDSDSRVLLLGPGGNAVINFGGAIVGTDTYWSVSDGGNPVDLEPISYNNWTVINFRINYEKQNYDVYINGTKVGNGVEFINYGGNGIGALQLGEFELTGQSYFDTIRLNNTELDSNRLAVIDDFEDGDLNNPNWSINENGGSISVVTEKAALGNHSVKIVDSGSGVTPNLQINSSEDSRLNSPTHISYSIYPENDNTDGRLLFQNGTSGTAILISTDYTNSISEANVLTYKNASGTVKVIGDVNAGSWNLIELTNISYANNEFDVKINGKLAKQDLEFLNSGHIINKITIDEQVGAGTAYYDHISAGEKISVSGTITDTDGNVLQGIDVTVNSSSASDISDIVGNYQLKLFNGTHKITASGSNSAGQEYFSNSTVVTVNGSDVTDVDIQLEEKHEISGEVTEKGNTDPLNGIGNVTISTNKSNRSAQTISDGTGSYSLNLTSGTHKITASHPSWFNESTTITIDNDTSNVDFQLERLEAWISGHVTDSISGVLIENADITVNSTSDQTSTNANGFYEIHIVGKGTYTITANKTNYAENSISVTIDKNTVSLNDRNITSQDIQLTPSDEIDYTVSGYVTNLSGTPVNNADIDVIGETVSTTTNSTGYYEVTLTNGDYTVQASHSDFFSNSISVSVNNANVTSANISIEKVYANVTGTVLSAETGNPIENAQVTANTTSTVVSTDSNGNYKLTLDKGTHNITASKLSYSDGNVIVTIDKTTVSKNNKEIENRDITLTSDDSGVIVSGYVTDYATDNGVSGVTITTNISDSSATTNNNGFYEIVVPNGSQALFANKSGYHNDSKSVNYAEGDTIKNENFTVLEAGLKFELRLQNYFKHNETKSYQVRYGGTLVSDKATVQSNNTSVLSINQASKEASSTADTSINKIVKVNASFFDGTYTDTVNVTVANESIEFIGIIPPEYRVPAFLGSEIGGSPVQWLFLILVLGVGLTRIMNSAWAGIAGIIMAAILFWILGFIGFGIMSSILFFGGFIALIQADIARYRRPTNEP